MSRGKEYEGIHRKSSRQDEWHLQRRREIRQADEDARMAQLNAKKEKAIQAKLEISQEGDVHEQQADLIAKKVVNGDDANVNQLSPASTSVQSKSEGGGMQASDQLQAKLESSKGSGQSMDDATKGEMETKMGTDFSDVKIHTGAHASEMSESINAKAFTHGQDVYFKGGNYNPSSDEGKELLAHELTHTVQQGEGIQTKIQRQTWGWEIKFPEEFQNSISYNQKQVYKPSYSDCLNELYYLNGNVALYNLARTTNRNDREFAWMVEDAQKYLDNYYKLAVNAKYDTTLTNTIQKWADSRALWNKKTAYSVDLIDKMGKVINDPTKQLVAKVKSIGSTESKYFAYLALAVQRAVFTDIASQDGKYGSSTEKALDTAVAALQKIQSSNIQHLNVPQFNPPAVHTGVVKQMLQLSMGPIVYYETSVTWGNDPFKITLEDAGPNLKINVKYAGNESADILETWIIVSAPKDKSRDAFKVFSRSLTSKTNFGSYNELYLDLYSDGKETYLLDDNVILNNSWSPAARAHEFSGAKMGESTSQTSTINIQSKAAVPSKSAAKSFGYVPEKAPEITGDPILQNSADALSRAKGDLDGVLNKATAYGILPANAYWWSLKKSVDKAYLAATAKDAANDSNMLRSASALSRMISYVKPKLIGIGPFLDKNFHPEGVATEATAVAKSTHDAFDLAVFDSFSDIDKANKDLAAANFQMETMYFQLTTLYLDKNRGMEQEVSGLQNIITSLIDFRDQTNENWNLPNIDAVLGVQKPSGTTAGSVADFRFVLETLRDQHKKADPKVFVSVMNLFGKLKYFRQIASMVSVYELFRYYHKAATNGLIAKGVDLVWPGNAGDKSQTYIDKLQPGLKELDTYYGKVLKGQPTTTDDSLIDEKALAVFYSLVGSKDYATDVKFIQTRLATIESVRETVNRIAIMVVAAAAAAVAGPVGGAIAAELGATATVVSVVEFATNALVFTTVDVAGRKNILGEQNISFWGELGTNLLFFGALKGVGELNKLAFTKFIGNPADYKMLFPVLNTTATMIELQGLSIAQNVAAGKDIGVEQQLLMAFQNFTMLASVHLGSFLVEPISSKWNAKTKEILLDNFKDKVDIVENNRLLLLKQINDYNAAKVKTPDLNANLLESITKQFNSEMQLLQEGKKAGKNNAGDVEQVMTNYEQRLAAFQLDLAQKGFDINIGTKQFFKYVEPGLVSYADGTSIENFLVDYYKDKQDASWAQDPQNPGVYHGKAGMETTTFVPESRVRDFAKSTGYAVIKQLVAEAKSKTTTDEDALKFIRDNLTDQDAKDLLDLLNKQQSDKKLLLDALEQREHDATAKGISLERNLSLDAQTNLDLFIERTGAKQTTSDINTFTYKGDASSVDYIKKFNKSKTVTGPDKDGTMEVTDSKGKKTTYIPEQRYKQLLVERKFGADNVTDIRPGVFKLSEVALVRLLAQCSTYADFNRLFDVVEARNPGSLENTQLVNFKGDYVETDGRTYIDNAEYITDGDLALKVRDNKAQYQVINDILSKISDSGERARLQKDIATLTDNARQLYIDLQGKVDLAQDKIITLATIGDVNSWNVTTTVNYSKAEALSTSLSGDPYTAFLDTKTDKGHGKGKDFKHQVDRDQLQAARDKMKTDPTTAKAELEAIQRRLNVKIRIENAGEKFELTYSDNELDKIYIKGKELGLSDIAIEDFIFTGSRKSKAISADELMKQMDNNVNIVNKRGYPFKFESKAQYDEFSQDYKAEATKNNIPSDDIALQGSALRTERADDVDSVIFVLDTQFDKYITDKFNLKITKNKISIDLSTKNHQELLDLANDIVSNPELYNSKADTFAKAIIDQFFNSKSKVGNAKILPGLENIVAELSKKYPKLNIKTVSVQVRGGKFDIEPSMKLK